ncbi:hypothetical protein TNCV_1949211 [Trichonephila clavipes]|nr:hypothetical protein TNCV_1949211 [Trichonephila clavipes]
MQERNLMHLAVGKSWSCLLDGQRRAQLSGLPRVEGVACFRIITGHDYLQAHLFKTGLADSPLCPLCKSVQMTGEHLSDCPALPLLFSRKRTVEFSFLLERHLLYIGLQDATYLQNPQELNTSSSRLSSKVEADTIELSRLQCKPLISYPDEKKTGEYGTRSKISLSSLIDSTTQSQ